MSTNYVKCNCQHCNGVIEFDASRIEATGNFGGQITGQTIPCPHCGMDTILFVPNKNVKKPSPIPDYVGKT
jgi:hypothetical protein